LHCFQENAGKLARLKDMIYMKKNKAMINVWAMGRDPGYWIEPEKFYPEGS
jgi:hypothetical protein